MVVLVHAAKTVQRESISAFHSHKSLFDFGSPIAYHCKESQPDLAITA
jgi:hypothetical protein